MLKGFLACYYGSFRKFRVPYFGVLIIRIRLFGVLYKGSPILETPIQKLGALYQGSPGAFYGKFRVSYRVLSVTFWGIYVAVFAGLGCSGCLGWGQCVFQAF